MSLLSYEHVRPPARAIREKVITRGLQSWCDDRRRVRFGNDRSLLQQQIDTIVKWVDAGAPKGDDNDLPPAPQFVDGWSIGQPDAVFAMEEEFQIPATGEIPYKYFRVPTNLTEDRWIQAIEIRPQARAHVHHVLVYYQAPPDGADVTPIIGQIGPLNRDAADPGAGLRARLPGQRQLLATYAPGTAPQSFRPGTAMRLPAGSRLVLQMHYTANGTAGTDRSKVGLIFAKEPPATEIRATQFINTLFTIPAGHADYRVNAETTFQQDAILWGVFPHTHVRGKRWNYVLALPDGTMKPLLSVPRYDFNWQTYYIFKEPLEVPKGARILSSAWYDNSAANRSNPDPTKAVRLGDQTWEEMQYTGLLLSSKR